MLIWNVALECWAGSTFTPNHFKTNADPEYRAGVLSWLRIRREIFKTKSDLTNADLECRAGVMSWLSICLNAFETNADLECLAGMQSWLSIRRYTFKTNADLKCRTGV
ncbi:hypothetical protein DPMN_030753 [Dreissena polymorpha]|uniref:Uncharacterized protein n=1 Tax=Dreissena polymorpha TaxID=45954 RepID=A0A9D4M0Z6_DREPO|nr:hypothetical protein DPMN_030753 [Dreissena polymorpha]